LPMFKGGILQVQICFVVVSQYHHNSSTAYSHTPAGFIPVCVCRSWPLHSLHVYTTLGAKSVFVVSCELWWYLNIGCRLYINSVQINLVG
jgi:hypothetical protein